MSAEAIRSGARRVADLVAAVPDDALDGPTPAGTMTVGDLLDHLGTFGGVFTGAARKDLDAAASPGRPPSATNLSEDWRTSVPSRLAALAEAWSDPAAWTGQTLAGKLPASGELAGAIALDELIVHGWDLARATDQSYVVDEPSLELVRTFIETQVGDGRPIPREAVFAEIIPVPDGAPLLDRVVGLAGRDPSWTPGP